MLVSVLLFAVGLVLLIKGGDWFVDGATGIARRFHLPDIIVGATVVSIGTTLPEVMVSVTGALQGQGAMSYGNAIGSIICNTALIAAISVACNPGPVNTKTMKMPVIFFFSPQRYTAPLHTCWVSSPAGWALLCWPSLSFICSSPSVRA